jgi:hypothetical protein
MYRIIATRAAHNSSLCELATKRTKVVGVASTIGWAWELYERTMAEFCLDTTDLVDVVIERAGMVAMPIRVRDFSACPF